MILDGFVEKLVLQRASAVRRDTFIEESVSLCTKLRQERHKIGTRVSMSLLWELGLLFSGVL